MFNEHHGTRGRTLWTVPFASIRFYLRENMEFNSIHVARFNTIKLSNCDMMTWQWVYSTIRGSYSHFERKHFTRTMNYIFVMALSLWCGWRMAGAFFIQHSYCAVQPPLTKQYIICHGSGKRTSMEWMCERHLLRFKMSSLLVILNYILLGNNIKRDIFRRDSPFIPCPTKFIPNPPSHWK